MNKFLTLMTIVVFVSCKNSGKNAQRLFENDLNRSTRSEPAKSKTEDKKEDDTFSYVSDEVVITAPRITTDDSPLHSAECGDLEYSGTLGVIEEISKKKVDSKKVQPGDPDHDCSIATEEERQLCNELTIHRIAQNIKQQDEIFDGAPRIKHPLVELEESLKAEARKVSITPIEKTEIKEVTSKTEKTLPTPEQTQDEKDLSQEEQRKNFIAVLSRIHQEIRKSKDQEVDPSCVDEVVEDITEELNEDCEEGDEECEYTEEEVSGTLSADDILEILKENSKDDKIKITSPGDSDDILRGRKEPQTGSGTSAVSMPTFNTSKLVPEINTENSKKLVKNVLAYTYIKYLELKYNFNLTK